MPAGRDIKVCLYKVGARASGMGPGGEKLILFGLAPLYKPYFYLENLLYSI
jgi:hypothetical protein